MTKAEPASRIRSRAQTETTIVAVETLTSRSYPQLIHVVIETAGGLRGLGETFHRAEAVAGYIHAVLAPALLGEDPVRGAQVRRVLGSRFDGGNVSTGTATIDSSAASAVDIALWDLRGKVAGLPIVDLLGGRSHPAVPVYNTCASHAAAPVATDATPAPLREAWTLGGTGDCPYDDYALMFQDPARLARELLADGIRAVKLFPFGPAAQRRRGTWLAPAELEEGVRPFRLIREEVGDEIELIVDLNFWWTLAPARRIVAALEPYRLLWIEDPLRWGARRHLAALQAQTSVPIAAFDYAVGLEAYLRLIEEGGVSILRVDPQWTGGISEAARIAGVADAVGLDVIFHDCAGPVGFIASSHLSLHAPTTFMQESVRAYWRCTYPQVVTQLPTFEDGCARPPEGAGLGTELAAAYLELPDLRRARSELRPGGGVRRSPPA